MSRDHRQLRVFHDAHRLALDIYKHTMNFPRDEWYGLRQQLRRSALSVPTNIVEGSARRTTRDYCNFLNTALGSACELAYLVTLASELRLIDPPRDAELARDCGSVVRQLQRLVSSVETLVLEERRSKPRFGRPSPKPAVRSR